MTEKIKVKPIIPKREQQNVLDILWALTRSLEVKVKPEDILDRRDVETSYELLNRIGVIKESPYWLELNNGEEK